MNSFQIFLYESGISLAVLYLLYWALLRKETWFGLNRIILAGSVLLAFLIPFIKIGISSLPEPGTVIYYMDQATFPEISIVGESAVNTGIGFFLKNNIIPAIYLTGILFFLVRLFMQFFQISALLRKSTIKRISGSNIVYIKDNISPFSFFNYIFINPRNISDGGIKKILKHEREHINRGHTIDIIIMEFLTIIQWFNPFVWLFRHSLRETHEYEADRRVVEQGENRLNYQKLLIQQVFGNQFFNVVHHFKNHSLIKKRIAMLTKTESKQKNIIKSLLLIPAVAMLVLAFSFTYQPKPVAGSGPEFIFPVKLAPGTKITTPYGMREHPVYKVQKFHNGIDIVSGKDAKILATAAGTVSLTEINKHGFGNRIKIEHSDAYTSMYAHLAQIHVKKGDKVKVGQIIGIMGETGMAVGPHLHFELIKDGKNLNPVEALNLEVESLQEPETAKTETFFIVEEMPVFDGKKDADFKAELQKYVAQNTKYPPEAAKEGISGKVFVRFIIEADGALNEVSVKRGANPLLDAEAVRVIKSTNGMWEAGKQRGKNVRVEFTFPINFALSKKQETTTAQNNEVFFIVEEMPSFNGKGQNGFREYLAENVQYPAQAVKDSITGRVFISFIVEKDGSVSNAKVVRGIHPLLDAEALRVVKTSPKWEAGKQKGKIVRVSYTFPINFALQ